MNQFKNGTLLVVIATIVTVVLILMTGRDTTTALTDATVEENKIISTQEAEPKNESSQAASVVSKAVTQTEAVISDQKPLNKVADNIAKPEGPFSRSSVEVNSSETKTDKVPQVIFVEPSIVVATSEQHQLLDHIVQPIWMDQKLGDFKSIENNESVFKIMPTTAEGLQGDNPTGVVTRKNDKFSKTMISSAYNYQQMPMYNGGYYIAPMPSYLMPSMLPEKAKTEN